jgi:hypothetical protein
MTRASLITLMFFLVSCTTAPPLPEAGTSEPSASAVSTTLSTAAPPSPSTTSKEPNWEDPPPLFLRAEGQEIIPAWLGYCWSGSGEGYCAEFGLEDPPVLAIGSDIEIVWPLAGWDFEVTPADQCQPGVATVEQLSNRSTLSVTGEAGRYYLHLNGNGPEGSTDYSFAVDYQGDDPSRPVGQIAPLSLVQDGEAAVNLTGIARNVDIVESRITLARDDGGVLEHPMTASRTSECSVTLSPEVGMLDAAKSLGAPPWAFTLTVEMADGRQFHTNGHTAFWALTLPPAEPANFRTIEEPLDEVQRSSLLTSHLPD